jgi:hypothetical protein
VKNLGAASAFSAPLRLWTELIFLNRRDAEIAQRQKQLFELEGTIQ